MTVQPKLFDEDRYVAESYERHCHEERERARLAAFRYRPGSVAWHVIDKLMRNGWSCKVETFLTPPTAAEYRARIVDIKGRFGPGCIVYEAGTELYYVPIEFRAALSSAAGEGK